MPQLPHTVTHMVQDSKTQQKKKNQKITPHRGGGTKHYKHSHRFSEIAYQNTINTLSQWKKERAKKPDQAVAEGRPSGNGGGK